MNQNQKQIKQQIQKPTEFNIKLNTINDIYEFVSISGKMLEPVRVKSDNFVVDGKSLLGLFSLNHDDHVVVEVAKPEYVLLFAEIGRTEKNDKRVK